VPHTHKTTILPK